MTKATHHEENFSAWIGKTQRDYDILDLRQVRLMQTILSGQNELVDGNALPLLWHWLYFPTTTRLDELGQDGHPKLGGFLPPVALPRRMWAGGRLQFLRPLKIGGRVDKKSTIANITAKQGKSGKLCFVTVAHEFSMDGKTCVLEEHDIVYRENRQPTASAPIPPAAPDAFDWKRNITPGPVMLFRYSALTFNGHRIHYDVDYCRDKEGLEDLVFHGPLTATVLVNLAVQNSAGRRPSSFEFRAISPLYGNQNFMIAGREVGGCLELWAQNSSGQLAMSARMKFD